MPRKAQAEAGCSHAEIKAITGHSANAEVARCIREANQKLMAENAMARLLESTDQHTSANRTAKVSRLTP